MSDLLSGTRVAMEGHPEIEGWTEFPDPGQNPPDTGMVLVIWDNQRHVVWEYVSALIPREDGP